MKSLCNKKGSFSIFAIMLFLALIFALWIIIKSAGVLAISSTVNSFGTLWGKSILGEYDHVLRDRYGLLAFNGDKFQVERKLQKYIDYSFGKKSYIIYESPKCDIKECSLLNCDVLKEQIEMAVATGTNPLISEYEKRNLETYRSINSEWIIESLPSYNKTEDLYVLELANKIKEYKSLESLVENFAIDKYIFNFFKDYMKERDLGKTYYNYEVEYIISGKLDELEIKKDIEDKIVILRNILNLYYLYTCPEKRDGAMALATAVTPGAMSFITQGIILETWAYAEAKNDLKILYDNKQVTLLKDDYNWALTLENVFNVGQDGELLQNEEIDYLLPKTVEGISYSDYLRILLCGVPEETKLLRIMDLIQINLKYIYVDYFLVKDYYCGFSYSIKVNDIVYEFKEKYVSK